MYLFLVIILLYNFDHRQHLNKKGGPNKMFFFHYEISNNNNNHNAAHKIYLT